MSTELITSAVDVVGPPDLSDYELERNKPMPSLNHGVVQLRLGAALLPFKEFTAACELTLKFPDGEKLTPDLCAYPRRAIDWSHDIIRMSEMPRMVVEIVSPRQGHHDIMEKLDRYFAHGVESAWVVQPALKTIAIYRPDGSEPDVFSRRGEAHDTIIGLSVRLEDIFA